MRNLLALIGLFCVLVVGVGYWRGWFRAEIDSQYNIRVELNTKRATEDVKDGTNKLVDELKKSNNSDTATVKGVGDPNHIEFVGPRPSNDLLSPPR